MKFEVYRDDNGEYRWRLIAANGRIIADSAEGYVNKDDCLHGIELVHGVDTTTEILTRAD